MIICEGSQQSEGGMTFAVIFEVEPKAGKTEEYLRLAAALRPILAQIDGFIAIERFAGRRRPGRVLSLSVWRDEKAVIRWRTFAAHRAAQREGRAAIFADYHLRVGETTADTASPNGKTLPQQLSDLTEAGEAKCVTITELPPGDAGDSARLWPAAGAPGIIDAEWFESLTTAGKSLLLAGWRDPGSAQGWQWPPASGERRHRQVRIIRDYGMFDRAEAPQYYPPASAFAR
jgi:heme-degrading monooxygenase HmoA